MTCFHVNEWRNCLVTVLFIFSCLYRYNYEECQATADWLLSQTAVRPLVGIVCGSGMGGLADMLKDQVAFKYSDIPNFPQSTGMCFNLVLCMLLYSLFFITFYACSTYFVLKVFPLIQCCSAWPRRSAGVWDFKGEAVCLHAGKVSSLWGICHPEGTL